MTIADKLAGIAARAAARQSARLAGRTKCNRADYIAACEAYALTLKLFQAEKPKALRPSQLAA